MASDTTSASYSIRLRKSGLSIRGRLILLALLAVVPLMLDRVRLLETGRAERIELAHREAVELAKRGVEAQRQIVTTVNSVLQVIARSDLAAATGDPDCAGYLATFTADIAWLKGLSIAGENGRIICSTAQQAAGLDISDRDYFSRALAGRELVLSSYLIVRAAQKPAIVAALPATAKGGARFVIMAMIDLDWIGNLVARVGQRSGASVTLVDGRGTLLAAHPVQEQMIGRTLADQPLVRSIIDHEQGTTTAVGIDGVQRIFAFARIPWTDAHLAVGIDESAVLERVEREISIAYLQLVLFGFLVLMVAWFGGERLIVEPIRLLARTAQRFGRGDLNARPMREEWAAEFIPLASALSEMAGKLAVREKELRAANAHLASLASIDALSNLANRRAFDARLSREWLRAQEARQPLALLMIDVDHFKAFNDHYGHVEGDECLRGIARVLAGFAESNHFVARYGGEEFALLLPGTDLGQATLIGERLRAAVADLHTAHAASPDGEVTVSVGVAALVPGEGDEPERLIEAADAGLYAAKRRGRNVVVAHAAIALEGA